MQAWVVRLPANPDQADAAWECMVKHSDLTVLSTHDLTMHFCEPDCPPPPGSTDVCFRVRLDDSPVPGTPGQDQVPTSDDPETTLPAAVPQLVRISLDDIDEWSPWGWLNEGGVFPCDHDGAPGTPPVDRPGFGHCCTLNSGVAWQTCGNNARVIKSGAEVTPIVGESRSFDFADAESDAFVGAQVFHDVNWWHDRMYAMGFDEVAGNYQAYNFGRGGEEETQGIGVWFRDNTASTWGTTTGEFREDGGDVVVKIQRGNSQTAGRWCAPDRTVLFHELTHAMTGRLYVGSIISGGGPQSTGLFEGWGDYFAIALTAKPQDDFAASYPVFSWPARPAAAPFTHYYFGARIYPYTQNRVWDSQNPHATNPLRYGHLRSNAPTTSPSSNVPWNSRATAFNRSDKYTHCQVWASVMLQCRYELSLLSGMTDANGTLMQLAVDSMKLSPASPNYVQARDALLQAELVRHGGRHQPAMWRGFAARGLGWGAASPDGAATTNILDSLGMPQPESLSFFFPDGVPRTFPTCVPTDFEVIVVSPWAALTEVAADGSPNPSQIGLRAVLEPSSTPGGYVVRLNPGHCRQAWDIWVEACVDGGLCDQPLQAYQKSAAFTVLSGVGAALPLDDMESQSWPASMLANPYPPIGPNTTATAGLPAWGDPVGGGMARPSRDATPGAGSKCWVTEQRDPLGTLCNMTDDVDSDGLGVAVRSPDLASLPDSSSVLVELSLWYGSADGANTANCVGDAASETDAECVLEWFADDPSGTAVLLGTKKLRPPQSAFRWQTVRFTAPTGTAAESHIRVRFIDPPPDSIVEGGVDDVRVWTIVSCEECCDGDVNADGNVDQDDVLYLTTVIGGGPDPVGIDPDFNRDGNADQDDITALINKVGGGPCP
ncbi:MAG: hypothetical protein DYG92_14515 [Leptolyngbya sp. PLA1]|nr:hypothetical protein [Leptolyngbya sp. PLA1]